MKNWRLHTGSCVCNGVAATVILFFFIYELINNNSAFTFDDVLGTFVVLLGYTVYIVSDIWGLKLYNHYKNLDSVSFTDTGKTHVIMFFLLLLQAFIGYGSYFIIRRLILDFPSIGDTDSIWGILGYLILIVFFTSIIVFIGFILLLRAIKRNRVIIKKEIENIGNPDFSQ